HLLPVAHVDVERLRVAAQAAHLLDGLVPVGSGRGQVGDGDAHSLLRQLVRDAAADAARATGDDRDRVPQFHGAPPLAVQGDCARSAGVGQRRGGARRRKPTMPRPRQATKGTGRARSRKRRQLSPCRDSAAGRCDSRARKGGSDELRRARRRAVAERELISRRSCDAGARPPPAARREMTAAGTDGSEWRRGWDSNPRYACAHTRFPVVPDRPLQHLSARPGNDKAPRSARDPVVQVAERVGFEPTRLIAYRFSRAAPSTTRTPLRTASPHEAGSAAVYNGNGRRRRRSALVTGELLVFSLLLELCLARGLPPRADRRTQATARLLHEALRLAGLRRFGVGTELVGDLLLRRAAEEPDRDPDDGRDDRQDHQNPQEPATTGRGFLRARLLSPLLRLCLRLRRLALGLLALALLASQLPRRRFELEFELAERRHQLDLVLDFFVLVLLLPLFGLGLRFGCAVGVIGRVLHLARGVVGRPLLGLGRHGRGIGI